MAPPRVSIVVTCYNLGRYLDEAMQSIQDQTFQEFEAIVVDDGSTDVETLARLDSGSWPRTRVVRTGNQGLPAAKNRGLREATGEYFCALDADDRLAPTFLERSVQVLDADPALAFASHWLRTFGDEHSAWTPESCELPALLDANTVNGAALVRRRALEAAGGFDERFRDGCEDWDLWITLVERGHRGTIIPEVLYHYRRRVDSMSRLMTAGDGHARLYRRLAEKHTDSFRKHLPSLLLRRETDIASLRRHIHDLSLEYDATLRPDLQQRRDDVRSLERRAQAFRAARAVPDGSRQPGSPAFPSAEGTAHLQRIASDRDRALERASALQAEVQRLREAVSERHQNFEMARREALRLDAARHAAEAEVDALRRSFSWRSTAPLRRAFVWIGRLAGRPR